MSLCVQALPSLQALPVAGAQVPSAGAPAATEQAMQSVGSPPPQAELQQTPSTQWPVAQSAERLQSEPGASAVR